MSDLPPQDLDAERAVLGVALCWPSVVDEVIAAGLTDRDFLAPAHGDMWHAIVDLSLAGEAIDSVVVQRESRVDPDVVSACVADAGTPGSAARHARVLIAHAARRRLIEAAANASRLAYEQAGVAEIVGVLESAAAEVSLAWPVESIPVDVFAGSGEQPYDWVVPHLLERGDRVLITAAEGGGKTLLLIQIAVQAAAGVHPTTWAGVPPVRCLYVDLELGERRIARHLRTLMAATRKLDPSMLRIISRPEGINLLGGDAAWLGRQLAAHPADLVCIGPVYKLHAGVAQRGDVGGEDMTRRIVAVLDRLRIRYGVALVMETHAPHAQVGAQRDLRPFGSSVWLRWPDFGFGLRRDKDTKHRFHVQHWRGPRDERWWPEAFERGGAWPWSPYWPNGMPQDELGPF